jgi:hypothetical protein
LLPLLMLLLPLLPQALLTAAAQSRCQVLLLLLDC